MPLLDKHIAVITGAASGIGRAIAGRRSDVFLVSKVWPNHVAGDGIARACEASLKRLGTGLSGSLSPALAKWSDQPLGRRDGF